MNIKAFLGAALAVVAALTVTWAAEPDLGPIPGNPPALQPLTGHKTPAYRAAKLFQRGVNLADYLEASPQNFGRGVVVEPGELAQIRREGFDHVRVPVGWHHFTGAAPDFTLMPVIFSRVDFIVTNCLKNRLAVMINIHHFDELDRNPEMARGEFLAIWRQLAAHYQKFPAGLAFELDNEPHDQATTALMNPIYAQVIAEIRRTNPHRTLFVEPGNWGSIGELKNLVLPADDNVIVSVHCYDPFYFTHQGASWVKEVLPTGVQFPGPPAQPLVPPAQLKLKPWVRDWIKQYNTLPSDKNPSSPLAFTAKLKYLRAWSDYYGRPVHLGEFGAYTKGDEASRVHFYAAFRQTAEAERLGWCIWDWSSGFRYWDKKNNRPMPGMATALFDRKE